jgi:hypothetical protein
MSLLAAVRRIPKRNGRGVYMDKNDFTEWWRNYPSKVGKLAAQKAYRAARVKHRASAQDLLSGLAAYIVHKPEWQAWAHPTTWLHQGRWADDYSKPAPAEKPKAFVPPAYRPYVRLADRVEREKQS